MKINLFYDTTEGITKFTTLDDEHISFKGKLVIVPAGFESDGASIPRFWWGRVQPISGLYLRSFLKHDYLYRNGVPSATRKEADLELYNDLRAVGMGYITANEVYYAVRAFGGSAWDAGHKSLPSNPIIDETAPKGVIEEDK